MFVYSNDLSLVKTIAQASQVQFEDRGEYIFIDLKYTSQVNNNKNIDFFLEELVLIKIEFSLDSNDPFEKTIYQLLFEFL